MILVHHKINNVSNFATSYEKNIYPCAFGTHV